jgi:hypothetical protein
VLRHFAFFLGTDALMKVVKLFNAIQQSQHAAEEAADEAKAGRGSGKPSLPAPILDKKVKGNKKGKQKDNIIGRGKEGRFAFLRFIDFCSAKLLS